MTMNIKLTLVIAVVVGLIVSRVSGQPPVPLSFEVVERTFPYTSTYQVYQGLNGLPYMLSGGAQTYRANWTMLRNTNAVSPFRSGEAGMWRAGKSFAYVGSKQLFRTGFIQSPDQTINAAEAYTNTLRFGTMPLAVFDWKYTSDVYNVPGWIPAGSITKFGLDSEALEEKDVYDRYAANLYGYEDQQVIASATNSMYEEIAFASFEDDATGNLFFGQRSLSSNNVIINFLTPSSSNGYSKIETIPILWGKGNKGMIFGGEAPYPPTSFTISGAGLDCGGDFLVNKATITTRSDACFNCNSTNKELYYVLEFTGVGFNLPADCAWKGQIMYTSTQPHQGANYNQIHVDLNDPVAHTGKSSLKFSGNTPSGSFRALQPFLTLVPDKEYVFSAWVSNGRTEQRAPGQTGVAVIIGNVVQASSGSTLSIVPEGDVIDGWQKIEGVFKPSNQNITLTFVKGSGGSNAFAYIDDIRIFPKDGSMQTYVYDLRTKQPRAILDQNNFATFYYYDNEGSLHLVKKETVMGIMTIQENVSYQASQGN